MKARLKLVAVGMNMSEATIVAWYKQPGERFEAGEELYAIETEKITQDVTATTSGVMVEILVPAGEDAEVGEAVCAVDIDRDAPRSTDGGGAP